MTKFEKEFLKELLYEMRGIKEALVALKQPSFTFWNTPNAYVPQVLPSYPTVPFYTTPNTDPHYLTSNGVHISRTVVSKDSTDNPEFYRSVT